MKKIKTLYNILYWRLTGLFWFFYPQSKKAEILSKKYSIGIVTYINRYDRFFRPLINNICKLFPDVEVIVAINGYYD